MTGEAIQSIRAFLDSLDKVEKDWDHVFSEIGKCDLEITDLLHEVELTDFDHLEGFQLSEEIKKVRKRRRELKNYQEVIRHVKDYMERNKSLRFGLTRVVSSMERTRNYQETRTYNPRVREDLKLCKSNIKNSTQQDEELEVYSELDLDLADTFENSTRPLPADLPDEPIEDSNEETEDLSEEVCKGITPLPRSVAAENEKRQEKEKETA